MVASFDSLAEGLMPAGGACVPVLVPRGGEAARRMFVESVSFNSGVDGDPRHSQVGVELPVPFAQ